MKLLDQYVLQTNKQPEDWTSQDILKYMEYVKKKVAEEELERSTTSEQALLMPIDRKGEPNHENV